MFKEFSYIVVVHAEGNHENHIQSIFKDEEGKGHYMYGVFKKNINLYHSFRAVQL